MLPNPYLLLAGFGPILFGLGLLVVLRILGRPDQNPDNPVAFLLLLTSRIAVILGVLVLLGGFGLLLAPVLVIVIGFVVREVRQAHRRMLLELLAVAAERNVPLAGAVEAFAAERSGWPARKARRLCALLGEGRTLSDALDGAWGLLSPEARMHIRLGEELSALAPALRRGDGAASLGGVDLCQLSGKVLYLTAVLLFLTVVVTFMFLKIVPAYVKIFADYAAKFPEATQRLYQCLHFVDKCPLLYPLCLAVPGLLGFFTLARALGLVRAGICRAWIACCAGGTRGRFSTRWPWQPAPAPAGADHRAAGRALSTTLGAAAPGPGGRRHSRRARVVREPARAGPDYPGRGRGVAGGQPRGQPLLGLAGDGGRQPPPAGLSRAGLDAGGLSPGGRVDRLAGAAGCGGAV